MQICEKLKIDLDRNRVLLALINLLYQIIKYEILYKKRYNAMIEKGKTD